jgi:hypothetical protein
MLLLVHLKTPTTSVFSSTDTCVPHRAEPNTSCFSSVILTSYTFCYLASPFPLYLPLLLLIFLFRHLNCLSGTHPPYPLPKFRSYHPFLICLPPIYLASYSVIFSATQLPHLLPIVFACCRYSSSITHLPCLLPVAFFIATFFKIAADFSDASTIMRVILARGVPIQQTGCSAVGISFFELPDVFHRSKIELFNVLH